MTYKDFFENIYKELKFGLEESKSDKPYFLYTYIIPSYSKNINQKYLDRNMVIDNIEIVLGRILNKLDNKVDYYRRGDIYSFTNDLSYVKKKKAELDLKIQFIPKKPPDEERDLDLFYYDLRDSDIDNGFTIEKNVLVNCIGSLVTNKDILKGKECITDKELFKMEHEEVGYLCVEQEEMQI